MARVNNLLILNLVVMPLLTKFELVPNMNEFSVCIECIT